MNFAKRFQESDSTRKIIRRHWLYYRRRKLMVSCRAVVVCSLFRSNSALHFDILIIYHAMSTNMWVDGCLTSRGEPHDRRSANIKLLDSKLCIELKCLGVRSFKKVPDKLKSEHFVTFETKITIFKIQSFFQKKNVFFIDVVSNSFWNFWIKNQLKKNKFFFGKISNFEYCYFRFKCNKMFPVRYLLKCPVA